MYVGRIMCTDLVTAPLSMTLIEADEQLKEKKISHLIVIDENMAMVGILSDRDLKLNQASPATSLSTHELNYILGQLTVEMIMVKNVITITPDTTIERAAFIMQQNSISALPVVENDETVGIITTHDVVDVLLESLGMREDCVRLIVLVKNEPGVIGGLTSVLGYNGINIQSLVTWPEKGHEGYCQIILRIEVEEAKKAVQILTDAGYQVITEYVKDHTPFLT